MFNAIQAKVEVQSRGYMYIETIINGKPLQAILDTEVDTVYMDKKLADDMASPTTRKEVM